MPEKIHWYSSREEASKPTLRSRVRRLVRLLGHPRDAWLTVRLLSWSFILPILKRVVPLKKLAPFMWIPPVDSVDTEQKEKIAAVVRWIYIFIFPGEKSCLERSLLLYRFLSRSCMDPRLVTGMRRMEDETWKGHAWIVVDGKPFEEAFTHIQDYRELIVFGPEGVMKQIGPDSTETTQ